MTPSAPSPVRRTVTVATVVVLVAAVVVWAYAVPREVVCPLVDPPPPGCTPESRRRAGVLSTVVLGAAYALVLAVVLTVGRRRRRVADVAVTALGVCASVAVVAVLFSTGFAL